MFSQAAYIFTPSAIEEVPARPAKRRKISSISSSSQEVHNAHSWKFEPLLNGLESPECGKWRQQLYEKSWAEADCRIQVMNDIRL